MRNVYGGMDAGGAYHAILGTLLITGTLGEVSEQIVETRAAARERHGWIMDIYLLRKLRNHPHPG